MQREATAHANVDSALRGPANGTWCVDQQYLDLLASRFVLLSRLPQAGAMVC